MFGLEKPEQSIKKKFFGFSLSYLLSPLTWQTPFPLTVHNCSQSFWPPFRLTKGPGWSSTVNSAGLAQKWHWASPKSSESLCASRVFLARPLLFWPSHHSTDPSPTQPRHVKPSSGPIRISRRANSSDQRSRPRCTLSFFEPLLGHHSSELTFLSSGWAAPSLETDQAVSHRSKHLQPWARRNPFRL